MRVVEKATVRSRKSIASILAVVAAFTIAVSPALTASASSPEIEVSTDGVNYVAGHSVGLFQNIDLAVPGDTQTESLWVRNLASSAGYLRVVVTDVISSDPMFAHSLVVRANTDAIAGDPVQLSKASPCSVIVEGDLVAPGDAIRVTATLTLGDLDAADGQGGTASFSVRASFSDAAVGSLPPTSCGAAAIAASDFGPPAVIAMTGSDLLYPLLVTGAGALGAGLFLLIAARRRRQEDE